MRVVRLFTLIGSLLVMFGAYNNFSMPTKLIDGAKSTLRESLENGALQKTLEKVGVDTTPEKQWVQINGKFYEKTESGVYEIDGVPTFAKEGKKSPPKAAAKNPTLGPPIDLKIYKDAMGLDENDEFFKREDSSE